MEKLSELIEREIAEDRWTEECADWPCINFHIGEDYDDKLWVNARVNLNDLSERTLHAIMRGPYSASGSFIQRVLDSLPIDETVSHSRLMREFSGENRLQIDHSYVNDLGVHLFKLELFMDDDASIRERVVAQMDEVVRTVYSLDLPSAVFDPRSCLPISGTPKGGIIVSGLSCLSQGSIPEQNAYSLINRLRPALAQSEIEMLGRYDRGLIEKRGPLHKTEFTILSSAHALSVGDLNHSLERFENCDYMLSFSIPSGDYMTHSADDGKVSLDVITGQKSFAVTLDRVWGLYQLIHPTSLEQAKQALERSRSKQQE